MRQKPPLLYYCYLPALWLKFERNPGGFPQLPNLSEKFETDFLDIFIAVVPSPAKPTYSKSAMSSNVFSWITRTHARTHTHTHVRMHTHTHTHTHIIFEMFDCLGGHFKVFNGQHRASSSSSTLQSVLALGTTVIIRVYSCLNHGWVPKRVHCDRCKFSKLLHFFFSKNCSDQLQKRASCSGYFFLWFVLILLLTQGIAGVACHTSHSSGTLFPFWQTLTHTYTHTFTHAQTRTHTHPQESR